MTERSLSDAVSIDPTAEETLARAGVRTLQELSDADPESLAMASGIPIGRIREWQQRARRAGARPARRSPLATGWMIAIIGLIIAILLGWALMSIGAARIKQAEQIRVAAESRLQIALSFAAKGAIDELRQARLALHNKNWGSAQTVLSRVEDHVTFMEQVAPEGKRKPVSEIRERIGELQRAVGEQSKDSVERLDALEAALDQLRQAE